MDTNLKFNSDTVDDEDRSLLKKCGVKITKAGVITIPAGYITDLASVPRVCWGFMAPFDVARAAVVHDMLYEKINGAFNKGIIPTKEEREKPDIINASRRKRIALGSGRTIQDVNRLMKQFNQMKNMIKKMKNKKNKNLPFNLG